jgi:hypothetical protein
MDTSHAPVPWTASNRACFEPINQEMMRFPSNFFKPSQYHHRRDAKQMDGNRSTCHFSE